jgi:hypothetical protein
MRVSERSTINNRDTVEMCGHLHAEHEIMITVPLQYSTSYCSRKQRENTEKCQSTHFIRVLTVGVKKKNSKNAKTHWRFGGKQSFRERRSSNFAQWSIPTRVQRVVTQLHMGRMPSYLWVNVETMKMPLRC